MGRLIPFIIIILLLLGLIVGIPFLLQTDKHRAELAAYLTQKLHHPVQIGKLDAGLFPPALRLQEVTVSRPSGTPFLQADRIDVQLDWSHLLRAKIQPGQIHLNHWTLIFLRRPDGSWDCDEWFEPVSKLPTDEHWPLRRLAFREGECHWKDSFASGSPELVMQAVEGDLDHEAQTVHLTSTLSGVAAPATLTFEGKGHFLSSPQWSGDLRLADEGRQWQIHMNDQAGKLDGQGQSQQWSFDHALGLARFYLRWTAGSGTTASGTMLGDWKSHFTLAPGSATFSNTAGLGGGLTVVKGEVLRKPVAQVAHLTAAFQNIPIQTVAAALDLSEFTEGRITGFTRLDLAISSRPWTGATGDGSVEATQGRYRFPPNSLKSLSRAHTMIYIKKKFPDFADRGLPYKKLSARWHMAANGLCTLEGSVNDGDVRAAMAGQVDGPRRGIDAYTRLDIHETSPARLKDIPGHYLFGPPGHEQVQPIFGRLQGTWNEWILRAVPTRKIPASVQNKLRTALKTK